MKNILRISEIVYNAVNEAFDFNDEIINNTEENNGIDLDELYKKEFLKIRLKDFLKTCYGIGGNNAGFLQTPLTIDTGFLWFKQLGTNNLTQAFWKKLKQSGFSTYMYSKFLKYANQNNTKLPAKTFINLIREISKKYFANSEIRSFTAYVSPDKNLIIFNNINQGIYKSVIYYNNSFASIDNALNKCL